MVQDALRTLSLLIVAVVVIAVLGTIGLSSDARAMMLAIVVLAVLVVLPIVVTVSVVSFSSGRTQGVGEEAWRYSRPRYERELPAPRRGALPPPDYEQARRDAYEIASHPMTAHVVENAYRREHERARREEW